MTNRPSEKSTRARNAGRIVEAARHHLFAYGYSTLTMDELAHELGISKKTLYLHFPGKDAIVGVIIDDLGRSVRAAFDAVLGNPELTFTQKLQGVIDAAGNTMGRVNPVTLRDLQRFAPPLYQKIEDLRQKNIPLVFGRLIRAGIAEGKVRPDIDPDFATEYWLQAIRGLVQPATLERIGLTLRPTLAKALNLFFSGLLTPAGRKDYEKHIPS